MEKIKQQVFLSTENYVSVIKFMQENRHENTSRAINDIITKYHQEREYYQHNIGKLQNRLIQMHTELENNNAEITRLNKRIRELKGIDENVD